MSGNYIGRDVSPVSIPASLPAATQAEMEAALAVDKAVTPARQQFHPLMPKAWAQFNGALAGTNPPNAGFNVTSITRNGVGNYTVNFTTPFSSGTYGFLGTCESSGGITLRSVMKLVGGVQTATQFQLVSQSVSDVASAAGVDASFITVVFFGDQ